MLSFPNLANSHIIMSFVFSNTFRVLSGGSGLFNPLAPIVTKWGEGLPKFQIKNKKELLKKTSCEHRVYESVEDRSLY